MSSGPALPTIGLIVGVGGTAGAIALARRAFYRRNQYGVEQFQNLGSATGDGCLRVVCVFAAFIGFCLAIGGLIGLAAGV